MPSICFSPIRVPVVRVTRLDSCGVLDDGACASVTTDGIITVEQTAEYNERQDFFTLTGDGQPCITDTSPPILKWINLVLTFCKVDPEMFSLMTGEPLVLDDAATPNAVGFRTRQGSINTSNFAFEGYSRISGSAGCSGSTQNFGYFLLPWVVEGTVGDITLQNGLANFIVNARTKIGSQWGTGPYNVITNQTGVNSGNPGPLLVAVGSTDHRHIQLTNLAPPLASCGCTSVPLSVTVAPTSGAAPLAVTLTVPTVPAGGVLPAVIDWGDGSALQQVTVGPTVPHTYTTAGTRTVRYWPKNLSSANYLSAPITAT